MEYYELQESGLLTFLLEKIDNMELDFHVKIERLIYDALEDKINELPEYVQMRVEDEIFDFSGRLADELENIIKFNS